PGLLRPAPARQPASPAGPAVAALPRGHVLFLRPGPCPSANWRQVLYLLLGQVEPDPVLDLSHRAGRDGDFLLPPEMPFPEQYVGHPVVARIDLAAMYPPDLTVEGMDGLTALDVCRTQRNNVLDNGLHRR